MNTETLRSSFLRGMRLIVLAALVLTSAAACSAPAEERSTESKPVVTDEQYAALDTMNKHAEQAYQSMKDGDYENAKGKIVQLSVSATRLSFEGITSIEGMGALTESISAALHSFNSIQPNEHEQLLEVIRVRLAVDALSHPKQPMWLDFRKPLSEDLTELENAAKKRDQHTANSALKKWRSHVKLIRPAVLISRDASEAVKLDSMTAFFDRTVGKKEWGQLASSMPNLTQGLQDLFRQNDDDQETILPLAPTEEPPHPFLWSLAIGSVIVIVLTYVAWRRYHSESAYVRVKSERDFDRKL
ncbi:sporulation protein YpjB [Paenibacillus alkalitolerans]|uniref:sporulation protein YpjB n=1 Tax=Paenibacillus alkalitolerans TaxID=2799335 RepID=UPI0018F4AC86|nr:sporulation protein YpjB [Paenibacillus alkalitolerans]